MEFPTETVLGAVKDTIDAIDWLTILAAPLDAPNTIRHARYRYSTAEERTAIAIRWDGDEPEDSMQSDSYLSSGEMLVKMSLSIEIDADLDPEPTDGSAGADETGLKKLTRYANAVLKALRAEGSIISNFSDFVQYGGLGPDEDNISDEGRLVLSLFVLYRVRSDDPTVLLATGVNYG